MKLFKIVILASVFSCAFELLSEAIPGSIAPKLRVAEWIKNGPISIQQPQDINLELLYVIEFWGTWSTQSVEFIPHLNFLQKKYRDKGLIVVGISREKTKTIKDFVSKRKDMDYAIAADFSGKTSAAFLKLDPIPRIFIVNGKRKVLWEGDIVDLERVLEKIYNGEFDLDKQKEISALRKKMEFSLQAGAERNAEETSNKILKLDPRNPFALRGRLFLYEKNNQLKKALDFVNKLIKKDPSHKELCFIKLELMLRAKESNEKITAFLKKLQKNFKDDSSTSNELALAAMNNMPFGAAPLGMALSSAQNAVAKLSKKDDNFQRGACHSTLAQAYYSIGLIDKALSVQQKACELLKGSKNGKSAQQTLEYYIKAKELNMLNKKEQ